jgi:16S rRNA (uracil1498-N3)-methyltransferase
MPVERYFYDGPLTVGAEVHLDEEEKRHIKVTRIRPGNSLEIVNGKGELAFGTFKDPMIYIDKVISEKPKFKITLVQGICRINHLEWILEKGTELGMSELILFPGERSEKVEFSENQQKRMRRILIGAMKQCGRLDLPKLTLASHLSGWQKFPSHAYYGDLSSEAPLFSKVWDRTPQTTFFVGPESGFSDNEIEILKAARVQGVKLHPYVLRTETAPLMALSLISHLSM